MSRTRRFSVQYGAGKIMSMTCYHKAVMAAKDIVDRDINPEARITYVVTMPTSGRIVTMLEVWAKSSPGGPAELMMKGPKVIVERELQGLS